MVFIQFDVVRGYFAIALPLGLLYSRETAGFGAGGSTSSGPGCVYVSRVIVIGESTDVEYVINQIQKNPAAGYQVSGVALPTLDKSMELRPPWYRIPVLSTLADVSRMVEVVDAMQCRRRGTCPGGSTYVRELGWKLEATGTELVLASGLTNVAGPRIHWRPVDTRLPLVHVELPQYAGGKHVLKRAVDISVASVALLDSAAALFGDLALIVTLGGCPRLSPLYPFLLS